MKHLMYVGIALILSFTIGEISVAKEGLKTQNLAANIGEDITKSSPTFDQSSRWFSGILLAKNDNEDDRESKSWKKGRKRRKCGWYGPWLCHWIMLICCDSSPAYPVGRFCERNWNKRTCGKCYTPCN